MISSIPELYSLHLFDSENVECETLVPLTTSKVRTLSADTLVVLPPWFERFLSITSFTVLSSEVFDLCELMEYMPMLKYLHVEHCRYMGKSYQKQARYKTSCAVHLKQLIVDDIQFPFVAFQKLLEATPNLKRLTISAGNEEDMFDACQWEHLISSSLPHLEIFKFQFGCDREYFKNDIINMLEQFQTDFWHKQHNWYTEYLLTKYSIFIYTTSYTSNKDRLLIYTDGYIYINSSTFDSVADLTVRQQEIEQKCQSCFRNIISFEFITTESKQNNPLKTKHIEILKKMISLSNLNYLKVSSNCKIETSSVLLQILKEASQLSSITIDQNQLISFCHDDELCKYLNKMIKKLDLYYDTDRSTSAFNNYGELRKFCKTFSNIEDLRCYIDKKTEFLFVLSQLSKLSHATTFVKTSDNFEKAKKAKSKMAVNIKKRKSKMSFVNSSIEINEKNSSSSLEKLIILLKRIIRYTNRQRIFYFIPLILFELLFPLILFVIIIFISHYLFNNDENNSLFNLNSYDKCSLNPYINNINTINNNNTLNNDLFINKYSTKINLIIRYSNKSNDDDYLYNKIVNDIIYKLKENNSLLYNKTNIIQWNKLSEEYKKDDYLLINYLNSINIIINIDKLTYELFSYSIIIKMPQYNQFKEKLFSKIDYSFLHRHQHPAEQIDLFKNSYPSFLYIKMFIDSIVVNKMLNEDISIIDSLNYRRISCTLYRHHKTIPTRWSFIFMEISLSIIYLSFFLIITNSIIQENNKKVKEILKIIHIQPL
ncbi:unnamed protein product, partial [Rotaria sp. Silwood2]